MSRRALRAGFSLIDVIVGIALMLVLFLALFGILRASLALSALTKAQAAAIELANTQIEYMRGLSYDALGTVGGIPAGTVPQTTITTIDSMPYTLRTYVTYFDDPVDGTGQADTNHITTDYKIGKVTVSYAIYGLTKVITLISNFVPHSVEAATNGGTLGLHIVDASGADLSDASVQITNTATAPTIDFITFSDVHGMVSVDGAATSTQYQIHVSRPGYSSAQTYERTAQNMNPTPGYLTVVKDQTTSATFAIDKLAELTLASFSPAETTAFSDSFTNTANLADHAGAQISDSALTLTSEGLSGSARSILISPSNLTGWGILSAHVATPSGTSAVIRISDATGVPLPDSVLLGNSVGFSSFPVDLTTIATSSYPSLSIEAELTSDATTTTPSILDWSLSHTSGPVLAPNIAFTLTGAKTIGTDGSGNPLMKTTVTGTTGPDATVTESLEWDAYTLSLSSAHLIESCIPSPYILAPAEATSTALLVGTPSTNTLSIQILNNLGDILPNAKVILSSSDYAATIPTSACGLAYFNELAAGQYRATVSAPGHAAKTFTNIPVAGHSVIVPLTLP